jgi:hypothetical protein
MKLPRRKRRGIVSATMLLAQFLKETLGDGTILSHRLSIRVKSQQKKHAMF